MYTDLNYHFIITCLFLFITCSCTELLLDITYKKYEYAILKNKKCILRKCERVFKNACTNLFYIFFSINIGTVGSGEGFMLFEAV